MSSFKKLSKSDVSVVPYYANKQWNLSVDCFPTTSDYLTIYKGTNLTSSFSSESDPKSEGQYERLIYAQINQLFYQQYTASLDTHSLANSLYYESASQQRPTSSYFIYNDNANFINNFPTGANDSIRVVAINQSVYGNKVLPNSFVLTSSAYDVKDDGYGNLRDGSTHIGNVFYAQGLAVITNQDYQLMFPTASCPTTTTTTTSTTTTTTTEPTTTTTTTSTTSTTTTAEPTTSTTTTTTTAEPTTSTTTTTTTAEPTTSTTTTTTTAEPTTSTTTTTTTAEPTTSTTTTTTTVFNCNNCNNWEYNGATIPAEGDVIHYYRCSDGVAQTIVLSFGDPTGQFCNCDDIGNPYSDNGTTLTQIGACSTPTTTTSTTTTTTTAAPTTTTTSTTTTTTTTNQVSIFIDNTNSLDIPITGMTINGVAVTYESGTNFTINAGNNGNFSSTELGTQTVVIDYGSHIPGQNIVFTDSDSVITCQNLNGNAGSFTISSSTITGGTTIYVTAADGACA